jgi:hypothetical protein
VISATPTASQQFAAATFAAFDNAFAASAVAHEQRLSLAGRGLRVRYVAPDLVTRFRPTLGHLETSHELEPVDLEIGCWDRALTSVVPPPPPWTLDDHLAENRIRGHVGGRVRATFDPTARILCLYDRDRRTAVLHAATSAGVPRWMDRAPFRTILTWWAADRGLALLHASAVAGRDGAVVLAGTSGAGKSTTAMACLAAGMDLLGDDACVVSTGSEPKVWSLYRLAKLEPDALRRLPALAALATDRHDEQTLIDPGTHHRGGAPLRAILLPQVTDATATSVVPLRATEAMRVLGPTTLLEGGGLSGDALGTLTEVARQVPCFRLELGTDLDGVVATVRGMAEQPV